MNLWILDDPDRWRLEPFLQGGNLCHDFSAMKISSLAEDFFFPHSEWFTLQNQHICWSIFCAANFEEAKDRKMSRNTFQLAALRHKPLDHLKWRIWPRSRIILHFVDVTRIKPAHFRRSNSTTLASFSGMVWTITTDFDLHNTSSNIAKLHVHSEFKVEFGDATWATTIRKNGFRFLHDRRKLHKDTSKRAMRLEPKNRIFAVNLRHFRLIFIDLYCHSNWNSSNLTLCVVASEGVRLDPLHPTCQFSVLVLVFPHVLLEVWNFAVFLPKQAVLFQL